MRILANENVPGTAVAALRAAGYDVFWIRTEMPGSSDDAVIALAHADTRLVVTFDKDFGELVYRRGLPPGGGVVLCRFGATSADALAERLVATLRSRTDWVGHFAVVEETRVRLRKLPTTG